MANPQRAIKDAAKNPTLYAAVRAADAQLAKNPMSLDQQPRRLRHFWPLRWQLRQRNPDPRHPELREAYARYQNDPEFQAEYQCELAHFCWPPLAHLPRPAHQP